MPHSLAQAQLPARNGHRKLIPWITAVGVLALSPCGFAAGTKTGKRTYHSAGKIKALVTAYCPCSKCCGKQADGSTSTGRDAKKYSGVAADPKAISYGRVVSIPGVGYRQVDDTGGAMRRSWRKGIYHLDLRFRSHQDALRWGRKWMVVEVYALRN